jgi:membrane-associated protease RseP (regulator of RpoE activity)
MTNCQGCGTEIQSQDRFCKNCGAPMAASVEDLADTRRFDPSARVTVTGSLDQNQVQYVPGAATFPLLPDYAALRRTQSFIKNLIHRKLFWLVAFLLAFLFVGTGVIMGRDAIRARRAHKAEMVREAELATKARLRKQAEIAQKSFEEAIQNAMGFVPAEIVVTEYPDLKGVFVSSLTSDDSPAAIARMMAGDVLTEFADQPVNNSSELSRSLSAARPGTEVPIKLNRDGEIISSKVRIGSIGITPFQAKINPRDQGFLGVGDVARRCCVGGTARWGLEIHRIVDNSPADLAGLQLSDVITEFDNQIVRTPNELARRIHAAKPRSKVKVKFYRSNVEQTVELALGHGW